MGWVTGCPALYEAHPEYLNLCLHISSISYPWHQAACPYNGSLALPYNSLIHDFIITLLDVGQTYYIGLSEIQNDLQWLDGASFSGMFDVWGNLTHIPDGCAFYYHQYQWEWDMSNCSVSRPYVCEFLIANMSTNIGLFNGIGIEGRVEIYHDNRWGTVTHHNPPDSLGIVICNMLGLTLVDFNVSSTISDGTGPIWLDGVNCSSLPATVEECANLENLPWGPMTSLHTADVKVRCAVQIMSSSLACLASTTTTTTTMTDSTTYTTTSSVTETVTMTTTEKLQPSKCIQSTTANLQTHSPSGKSYTYSLSIQPSSVVYGTVKPSVSSIKVLETPKYSKRSSAMYSTLTKKDNRPSAVAIGSFGVIILVSLIVSALFLDLITIDKERRVFEGGGEAPKGHDRQRRSPDGRESVDNELSTFSGASSNISVNESDDLRDAARIKTIETAQIHSTTRGLKLETFVLKEDLLDIPRTSIPPDEDTGHFAAFPSRPFIGDVMDIPSPFPYTESGNEINSDAANMQVPRGTNYREVIPCTPSAEELYNI
ncbi:uncharacterized protein LOC132560031 [Ylistrum balloti]|uniref:uncharacterized protein LOC132560031 n=1 Tax=Ylistrum balloti TaxID=509963 RepID=UPI0029059B38|nr:uncharacterized protein LOC132560031 [Ylistrum balloti]